MLPCKREGLGTSIELPLFTTLPSAIFWASVQAMCTICDAVALIWPNAELCCRCMIYVASLPDFQPPAILPAQIRFRRRPPWIHVAMVLLVEMSTSSSRNWDVACFIQHWWDFGHYSKWGPRTSVHIFLRTHQQNATLLCQWRSTMSLFIRRMQGHSPLARSHA